MVTTKLVRFAARGGLCAAAVLALAACGSNDNGYVCGYDAFGDPLFCSIPTTPSPPTQPAPVASTDTFDTAAAMTNVATQTFSYTVSGYDSSGNTYTVVYASTPGGSASFQTGAATPVPAVTANVTETFSENGSSPSVTTTTNYFDPSTYAFLGSRSNYLGGYEVVAPTPTVSPVPATATEGQSTSLFSANLYRDSTMTVNDGTLTETFALNADTATTALMCFDDTTSPNASGTTDGLVSGQTSVCYRISPAGTIQGIELTQPVAGVGLVTFWQTS